MWGKRIAAVIVCTFLLSGCTAFNFASSQAKQATLRNGAAGEHKPDAVESAVNGILNEMSGQNPWPTTVADRQVILVGSMNRLDATCRNYFGLLIRLDKERKAMKKETTLAGTTAVAILTAAARDAVRTIGYVGLAYGVINSYLDIETDIYLYEQAPQQTAQMTFDFMAIARSAIQSTENPDNIEQAKYILGRYAVNCWPPQIDLNVLTSISKAGQDATKVNVGSGLANVK
ncbi:hypothetical protein [Nitrospirillum viridazoti]|uniref:hypothetical protein n=1 Tax=Nitrospirillum viridazoti TaxID=3144925 RepID=UPI0011A1DC96|nr:hypothetical protein [Nitrospirillum amazonense]TWB33077.1 hypothetical protein FBZ91_115139 [Nitrospirillum amazonense]